MITKKARATLIGITLVLLVLYCRSSYSPLNSVVFDTAAGHVLTRPDADSTLDGTATQWPRPLSPATDAPSASLDMTLVIARLKESDVSWVTHELPDVHTAVYVVDDPTADMTVPRNKGHEAMVYLTYIIDHYDNLPDVAVFVHSDRFTWHNNDLADSDLVQMIKRLNLDWVRRTGYVNLRCHQGPGCDEPMHLNKEQDDPNKPEEVVFKDVWPELHPSTPMPDTVSHPCCAQYAVSRQTVRKYAREQYLKWREWLMETDLSDRISGRIWEYTWHYIFSGQSNLCLATHLCYCDGYSICFKSYADSDDFWAYRDKKRELDDEYKEWTKTHDRKSSDEANHTANSYESRLRTMNTELERRKAEAFTRGDDPDQKRKALSRSGGGD